MTFSIHHLSVNYDRTPALWDITFTVPPGHLVAIVGPNGAGKSTLIKAALGLTPSLSGGALFFGKPLAEVRKRVAYVPQRASIDWDFPITVLELVLMGRYGHLGLFRRPKKTDYSEAREILAQVGMADYAERQISQLSGGQQQRAFLARALFQGADIYFMDEPFAAIDLATEHVLVQLLKDLQGKGKTVFVVHHDLSKVESYFDWVVLLNLRLVGAGPLQEVFTPAKIEETFGGNLSLLDGALKLSQTKAAGWMQ